MSQLFMSDDLRTGASASASVLPMNIQGWFPLGLTGLISLQSKGLSRVFSSTVWKHLWVRRAEFWGQCDLVSVRYGNSLILNFPLLWSGQTDMYSMFSQVVKIKDDVRWGGAWKQPSTKLTKSWNSLENRVNCFIKKNEYVCPLSAGDPHPHLQARVCSLHISVWVTPSPPFRKLMFWCYQELSWFTRYSRGA